jgi:protein-S-isoprenylcysteine O-methyltransferase Ste14
MSKDNSDQAQTPPEKTTQDSKAKEAVFRWALQTSAFNVLFAAILFTAAGTLNWPAGVIFAGILIINQFLTWEFVIKDNPQLADERSGLEASTEAPWDRRLAGFMALIGPVLTLLVAGLDYRMKWTHQLPPGLQIAGIILAALGIILTIWAMHCNPFFYGRVRIEPEKGHQTVTVGPYRIIRHPGYAGAMIFYLATPLVLRSLWSYIPVLLIWIVTVLRTGKEEQFLLEKLDGYQDYAQNVRFRLLPWIW